METLLRVDPAELHIHTPGTSAPPLPVRQVQANPDTSWAPRKASMGYTGSAVLGVATMHKSNAVPVFSKDEASEISQMEK